MRTIYCYHFEEINIDRIKNGKNPLFKIGDTTIIANTPKESAKLRIAQQDTTSTTEIPVLDWAIPVPEDFMVDIEHVDKEFHKWLRTKCKYKYRKDKDREWFACFKDCYEAAAFLNDFLKGKAAPNSWNMRQAQQAAHDKMIAAFENGYTSFLLAAKMRFGKNFTFLNVINTLNKKEGCKNVLILTYKPSVFESLKDDITSHTLFVNDFVYQEYKEERDELILYNDKVNIVVCSAQMAGYKTDDDENVIIDDKIIEADKIRKNLKNLSKFKWDLIVTDECHYGTDTQNFKTICEVLNPKRTIFISGTPFKKLSTFNSETVFLYTYVDEVNDPDAKDMPRLFQYAIRMDKRLIATYKKYHEVVDYPTMTKAFMADENNNFKYPDVARNLLDCMINDIKKTRQPVKHLFCLMDHVNSCKAAAKYINDKYKNKIIAIDCSSDGCSNVEDLKEYVYEAENDGMMSISFSCGRFIEGVSIKPWNCVVMMHDGTSPERYFQTMFRGQTPDVKNNKEDFYVFDYNPERMLSLNHIMINELPTEEKSTSNLTKDENAIVWLKAAPIVIIDNDTDQTNIEVDFKMIESVYFNNTRIGANKMSDASGFNRIHEINISQETLNDIMSFRNKRYSVPNKDTKVNDNGLGGGKNRTKNTDSNSASRKNNDDKKNKWTVTELVQFAKDIMKFMPRYIGIYNCKTFKEIIKTLDKNDDNQQEMFFELIGYDYTIFKQIVELGVICEDGQNNSINDLWDEFEKSKTASMKHAFAIRWNIYQ